MSSFHSPNDLMNAGKEAMLAGKEPETEIEWQAIVNFWCANIHNGVQPIAVQLICKIFNVPLTEQVINDISKFQCSRKT